MTPTAHPLTPNTKRDPTLADLARVLRIVKYLLSPQFDRESIASDILVESWTNGLPEPSYTFIRQRCINCIRSRAQEQRAMRDTTLHPPESTEDTPRPDITQLTSVLDNRERQVIAYRFWLSLTIAEIAERLNCGTTQVQTIIAGALHKMREANATQR